jgi:hypothetical protein
VKHIRILAALLGVVTLGVVTLLSTSCGTGDKIGSVSISAAGSTGVINLAGLGGTMQLQVMANYTSGKQIDETNFAKYTVTAEGFYWTYDSSGNELNQVPLSSPPQTLTINPTGMITAVDPGICTWVNVNTLTQPAWAYTGDYMITATYRGFTSNPIFIPVASAASGAANTAGQCGPAATN